MRQVHRAGEKLFVDYCGQTVPVINAATGEVRAAQVFVATLGASNYTYAEATWSQSLPDWIGSHTRAFAFLSGVPRLVEWTPGRFLNWALEVGPSTRDLVRLLLENRPHPEMGYRSCLGLLTLAKTYGHARLEAACERALLLGSPSRTSVLSILKRGLDHLPLSGNEDSFPAATHHNVRGADYYH